MVNGLSVDQLQFCLFKQVIDVCGCWMGMGVVVCIQFMVDVKSEDLGGLMKNLDYGGQLCGGQGQLQLQVGWLGGLLDFQLGVLEGCLDVYVCNGQLLELEFGVGCVLGLFSVIQLLCWLMFDFCDFFFKGFVFNQVEGMLVFVGGMVIIDKVLIEGLVVNISICGQMDLCCQQFDQMIDVNLCVGNLLIVVGVVVGGLVGVVVGVVVNVVLFKLLGEIGVKIYCVIGFWVEFKVEVIDCDDVFKLVLVFVCLILC